MDVIPSLAALLSAASAALFILVGWTVQKRDVSAEARSAKLAFVTWWYGLAAVTVVGALQALPGFPLNLKVFLVLVVLLVFVLCVALVGLVHYLVFLYTSRRNILPYLIAGYAVFFVVLVAFIFQNDPTGVEATRWGPELQYESPVDSGPLYWTVLILFLVPPLAAAVAYLSLYRVARDPVLKRRILLVSLSIIVWFGSSLFGTIPGAQDADWYRLASRLISLAAAGVVLYAYRALRPKPGEDGPQHAPQDADSVYEAPRREVVSVHPLLA